MNERAQRETLPLSEAIRRRRAERSFSSRPVPGDLLDAILEDALRAPSGYNLQPTHLVLVQGNRRQELSHAALGQRQVAEAPVTVVIVADTRPDLHHGARTRQQDLEAGCIDSAHADFLRRVVSLAFRRGPFGVVGSLKGWFSGLLSWARPMPRFPAHRPREWAIAQAMIVATHVLLAAAARGIASCPMEGFDERRVRRLLGIPRRYVVTLLIPLGYAREDSEFRPRRTRLPLADLLHRERW